MDEAVLRDQRLKALEDDNRRLRAAVRSLEARCGLPDGRSLPAATVVEPSSWLPAGPCLVRRRRSQAVG